MHEWQLYQIVLLSFEQEMKGHFLRYTSCRRLAIWSIMTLVQEISCAGWLIFKHANLKCDHTTNHKQLDTGNTNRYSNNDYAKSCLSKRKLLAHTHTQLWQTMEATNLSTSLSTENQASLEPLSPLSKLWQEAGLQQLAGWDYKDFSQIFSPRKHQRIQ